MFNASSLKQNKLHSNKNLATIAKKRVINLTIEFLTTIFYFNLKIRHEVKLNG